MVGFFKLKSTDKIEQRRTGEAVMRLMRSVGDAGAGSEWATFKADPKAWLHKVGYRYEGPGAGADGEIPDHVILEPVYDTAEKMYVRIPWKGVLDPIPQDIQAEDYGGLVGANRFPVFLARYFMRKCR